MGYAAGISHLVLSSLLPVRSLELPIRVEVELACGLGDALAVPPDTHDRRGGYLALDSSSMLEVLLGPLQVRLDLLVRGKADVVLGLLGVCTRRHGLEVFVEGRTNSWRGWSPAGISPNADLILSA